MDSSSSQPSHSRRSSNVETTSADSRQILLHTQVGGTTNNGLLPLHSLPLLMMTSNHPMGIAHNGNASQSSATQIGNQYASHSNGYSHMNLLSSQVPVDLYRVEIPLSFMKAFNYQAMSQNSLQTGCLQMQKQQQERIKEKASMSMEIGRLTNKCSQLEKERDGLESSLAAERKECLKKQQELQDCYVTLDEMRKEAKQQESYLQKEIDAGNAKAIKIEELEKSLEEIKRKSEETDEKLQKANDINEKLVFEYLDSITKPTTLNKLLREQLAKNSMESPSSQNQMSTILASNISEGFESQGRNLMIAGTSSTKGTVALTSKKRKHDDDSSDSDTREGDK